MNLPQLPLNKGELEGVKKGENFMKVAISVNENSLDAEVDPRFGRCAYLIVVDTESLELIGGGKNEFASAPGGAGTQTSQWVAELGVEAVLTGNIGPNAWNILRAAKIKTYTGAAGTVRQAIQNFLEGKLQETGGATAPPHSGMRG